MQQSSMILFCDECGAANEETATSCLACGYSLDPARASLSTSPLVAPLHLMPPTIQEVVAGGQALMDFAPGALLAGRYRLCEEIGRGGFSIVYHAEDLNASDHTQVAIKRIYLRALSPREIIDATETFHREARMLSRFQRVPGIPRFYEQFTDSENWYLVMEYIEGITLEEFVQRTSCGYLAERETLEVGIALASIVQDLHNASPPVIFRDLKPTNIMVTPAHKLSLIDFGIAREFTSGKSKDTTPLGSPGFAPPEQYGLAQTDQRADIYSLGATLQTLLTGRDPLELAQGVPSRNPRPPSRALCNLLTIMINPDITRRPAYMPYVRQRLTWIYRRHYPLSWLKILLQGYLKRVKSRLKRVKSRLKKGKGWWVSQMGQNGKQSYWTAMTLTLATLSILLISHILRNIYSDAGIISPIANLVILIMGRLLRPQKGYKKFSFILGAMTGALLAVVLWLLHVPLY